MEYVALFLWLVICVTCGALMHAVLQSSTSYTLIKWLSAPGVIARKVSMTAAALAGGGTVTHANAYRLTERDVTFSSEGVAKVTGLLVPLVPLFACAVLLRAVNALLGYPIHLDFAAPHVSSLDAGGALGFLDGLFAMLSGLLHEIARADWGSLRWYVFLLLAFSLSFGASIAFDRYRQSVIGAVLLVVGLAVLCALFNPRSGAAGGRPAALAAIISWVGALRTFVMDTGGMAVLMMLFGMLAAIITGICVRLYEMLTSAATQSGKSRKSSGDAESEEKRQAA